MAKPIDTHMFFPTPQKDGNKDIEFQQERQHDTGLHNITLHYRHLFSAHHIHKQVVSVFHHNTDLQSQSDFITSSFHLTVIDSAIWGIWTPEPDLLHLGQWIFFHEPLRVSASFRTWLGTKWCNAFRTITNTHWLLIIFVQFKRQFKIVITAVLNVNPTHVINTVAHFIFDVIGFIYWRDDFWTDNEWQNKIIICVTSHVNFNLVLCVRSASWFERIWFVVSGTWLRVLVPVLNGWIGWR